MDEETKLILAIIQVENLVSITKDNEWKDFLYGHLMTIQVELERQLSLLKHDKKNQDKN